MSASAAHPVHIRPSLLMAMVPPQTASRHCFWTRDADERQRSRGVARRRTAVALRPLHACCMPDGLAQAKLQLYEKTCWGGRLRSVRPRQRRLK